MNRVGSDQAGCSRPAFKKSGPAPQFRQRVACARCSANPKCPHLVQHNTLHLSSSQPHDPISHCLPAPFRRMTMREPSRILSWLAAIPEQPPNPTSEQQLTPPTRKRKACTAELDQHLGFSRPISPPCSDTSRSARPPAIAMDDSEASQAQQLSTPQRPGRADKRRHTGDGADDHGEVDVDTTPRQPVFQVPYLPPFQTSVASPQISPTHSTAESQSGHSEASSKQSSAKRRRQSGSPRKQKMILEFEGTVVDANIDGEETPPEALNCLIGDMRRLADGQGFIHESEEVFGLKCSIQMGAPANLLIAAGDSRSEAITSKHVSVGQGCRFRTLSTLTSPRYTSTSRHRRPPSL